MSREDTDILIQKLDDYVKEELTSFRYQHSLGVARIASDLALIHDYSESRAMIAGLIHDMVREKKKDWLLNKAKEYHLQVGEMEKSYPVLLHGTIAAVLADKYFNIKDKEILEAISFHTTGKENLGVLGKIIYISDMIEPTRAYPGVEHLRKLAYNDLEKGFKECVKHNIIHLIEKEKQLHQDTVNCWNSFIDLGGPIGIKGKG